MLMENCDHGNLTGVPKKVTGVGKLMKERPPYIATDLWKLVRHGDDAVNRSGEVPRKCG
jgi:hypothetical protein